MVNNISRSFPNGIQHYTKGTAYVKISFPETQLICRWCPFCRAEKELERFWCRLTNEMIYDPFYTIGLNCPIVFEGTKKGEPEDENSRF